MTLCVVLQRIQPLRINWDRVLRAHTQVVFLHIQRDTDEISRFEGCRAIEVTDYSADRITELIRTLASEAGVECREVKLCTNDEYCLELCGHLREVLGIPGACRGDVLPFTDKLEMKQRLRAAGLQVPRFVAFDVAEYERSPGEYVSGVGNLLGFPLIAKPARGANNRDVELLTGDSELNGWCRRRARTGAFQLEEYIAGTLYHCNTIINDARVRTIQVGEYLWPCLDYAGGRPIGSITLDESDELYRRIQQLNVDVLAVLQPPQPCVTHLEVFRTPDDDLVFLEVAARAPGALVSEMCERRTGVHLVETALRLQMGIATEPPARRGLHCGWACFPCQEGIVAELSEPDVKCDHHIHWKAPIGTRYLRDDDAVVCEILFWNEDRKIVQRDAEYLRHWEPTLQRSFER